MESGGHVPGMPAHKRQVDHGWSECQSAEIQKQRTVGDGADDGEWGDARGGGDADIAGGCTGTGHGESLPRFRASRPRGNRTGARRGRQSCRADAYRTRSGSQGDGSQILQRQEARKADSRHAFPCARHCGSTGSGPADHCFSGCGMPVSAPPVDGQMLNVRIAGEGYFRVQSAKGGEGGVFFTRTGKFIIDEFGHIGLADGGLIIDPVITVPSHLTAIEFSADGVVTGNEAGDADPITFGRVQLAVFAKPSALQHVEGTLFKATADSGAGRLENPETPGVGALKQGELETVEETLRMQSVRMQTAAAGPKPAEPAAPAPEKSKPPTASIENEPIAPAGAHASDASDVSKPLANGANATKTSTDGTSGGWYSQFKGIAQVLGAMAVVIGLIFILKGLAKKFVPGAKTAGGKGVIEVLARHPLSKNQAIVLVRIGSQIVALNQGKESSESVLVINDATEVAKIIGQIEGKKAHSSQAGFTRLLANARVDLEETPDSEPELASLTPENLDEQLEEMAAAKRQLMELRQHVRTVRDRIPKS